MKTIDKASITKAYTENDIKHAVNKIFIDKWSVYKSAKDFKIPWSTLKDRLAASSSVDGMPIIKTGRQYNLSKEQEVKVVSYITNMRSIGFGLSATEVCKYAFQTSK